MTPDAIVDAITAVANAVAEVAKFLQTPEGQEAVKQARSDRAAFDRGVRDLAAWFEKLFAGRL